MKDGNVSKNFKVTNESDMDILISSVTTSCMCTVAYVVGVDGNKRDRLECRDMVELFLK